VCKLNPVTRDEDLQLIFSRFGTIKSCEVRAPLTGRAVCWLSNAARCRASHAQIVKDWKTGDSLQYAFIEFETQEQAAAAYFKMENVRGPRARLRGPRR
jgi:peptidyl-prolyl cis-trans isomerase-like 4